MTWTSDKPTVPGFYRWRYGEGYPVFTSKFMLRKGTTGLWYKYANKWYSVEQSAFQFDGPLEVPK